VARSPRSIFQFRYEPEAGLTRRDFEVRLIGLKARV
jgi:hypothetical protein